MQKIDKFKRLVDPTSTTWLSEDDHEVATYFYGLGFNSLQEILEMRVFDLMNMNRINAIRAEEIITCLYSFLNRNKVLDEAIDDWMIPQPIDVFQWLAQFADVSKITVGDIVLTEDMNLLALQFIYDIVRNYFFNSDEYNWKEYKFLNKKEYLKEVAKRRKEGKK